jgi:endonuclease/exonuclease/phosphatase family metal-dependent hydrolase
MEEFHRFAATVQPEVIALQEISPINGEPQVNRIAGSLGYELHYAPSGTWKGREEGLAILTRHSPAVVDVAELPRAKDDMSRVALAAILPERQEFPEVVVLNTHLAFQRKDGRARELQINACLTFAKRMMGDRRELVLCGDLNNFPGEHILEEVLQSRLVRLHSCWEKYDVGTGQHETFSKDNPWTLPELWPGRVVDHIFVSSGLRINSCEIVLTGTDGWQPVSDHFGVLADITRR